MDQSSMTRRRYERLSRIYPLMEKTMNHGLKRWRQDLFTKIKGPKVLEVGVGTGANLPFYPSGIHLTGIDFCPGMLKHARKLADRMKISVALEEMDAQDLRFPDNTFNTVVSTCVFCSIPDPIKGLQEIYRVLTPQGQLLMIEHVLSCRMGLRHIMNLVNPVVVRLMGANINRETLRNLLKCGFDVTEEDLWLDVLKVFVAKPMKGVPEVTSPPLVCDLSPPPQRRP